MLRSITRICVVILSLHVGLVYGTTYGERIASDVLNEERHVVVKLPKDYRVNISQRYPVLYLLDGEDNIDLAASLLERMHWSDGAMQHIVVGINNTDRLRDLAPTVNHDPRGPVGQGGGGDKFLDFIEKELIPLIEHKYRTENFRTFAGHSIGGLLVLHSFHTRPALFRAHLAFSPAVWWGNRETKEATKAYIVGSPNLEGLLYMNIGSEGGEMRQVYDSLERSIIQFRPAKLKFFSEHHQQISHGLTMPAGLFRAFEALFDYQKSTLGKQG